MPTPKFRTSSSKRDMRRSHHGIRSRASAVCDNCGSVKFPHHICSSCGHYRKKSVIAVKTAAQAVADFKMD